MLQVPEWLFIILVIISVIFLVAIALLLFWCIFVKTTRRGYKKGLELQDKLFLTPATPLMDERNVRQPQYMPYTVPKIVQTPGGDYSRPTSSMRGSPLNLGVGSHQRYYKDSSKPFDVSSCKSEPAMTTLAALGPEQRQFMLRSSLKNLKYSHQTSDFADSVASKGFSTDSNEGSGSAKSEEQSDVNALHSSDDARADEVYLHSMLLRDRTSGQADFVAKDHVVSYDQDGEGVCYEEEHPNGALDLSLFYDSEASTLAVLVNKVFNLPLGGSIPCEENFDVYVNFCIVPEDFYWQKTGAVSGTRSPVFNQTFHITDVLHHKLRQYTLCFLVMNSSGVQESVIGKVMVPLSELRAGMLLTMCKELGQE